MNPNTGAVAEFADDDEAKQAGYTLRLAPEAAMMIQSLAPATREAARPRFSALARAGVVLVTGDDVIAACSDRKSFRAYLAHRKRKVRKERDC